MFGRVTSKSFIRIKSSYLKTLQLYSPEMRCYNGIVFQGEAF